MVALKDDDMRVRQAAAWSLGELGDTKAVGVLIQTLQTKGHYENYEDAAILREDQLRTAAAVALGKLNSSLVIDPLIQALLDEKDGVRAAAAEALGRKSDSKVVEPLILSLQR